MVASREAVGIMLSRYGGRKGNNMKDWNRQQRLARQSGQESKDTQDQEVAQVGCRCFASGGPESSAREL